MRSSEALLLVTLLPASSAANGLSTGGRPAPGSGAVSSCQAPLCAAAPLSGVVAPTGNAFATHSAISVQGETALDSGREYLANFGLLSSHGSVAPSTPYRDKVALYAATVAVNGTGDVWAMNPLVTQMPGSGRYDAQGIELDFNNNNDHRGDDDGGAGLAPPVSYGLSITGAGAKRSTSALMVCGPGTHRIWNRGIVFANDAVEQASFQELGSPKRSLDIRGEPGYGVYQESRRSKNYFGGGTGLGTVTDPEATLDVGGDLRLRGDATVHLDAATPHGESRAAELSSAVAHGLVTSPSRRTAAYSGTATLDADGAAAILLPTEFPRLHPAQQTEFSYMLTAIGAPMPSLHVRSEVDGRSFRVAGGAPSKRVSWQLVASASARATLKTDDAAAAPEPEVSCDVAVVGAGVGGAYSAWRLIEAGAVAGSGVCLFERADRIGGRAYSLHNVGPHQDFTLDVGAYRFCGKVRPPRVCDEAAMPMVAGVVMDALKLPTRSYEEGTQMLEIADKAGPGAINAGYSVKAERMVNISLAKGLRWLPQHELVSIAPAAGGYTLRFGNGVSAVAKKVILNLPLLPLLAVVRSSPALLALADKAAGPVLPKVLTVPKTYHHIKLYVYYEEAWWYSLNLTRGVFPSDGKKYPGDIFWESDQQLPVYGRYHDGPVRCEDEATRTGCRGYLEAIYTSTGVGCHTGGRGGDVFDFFETFGPVVNSELPYTHITNDADDANGKYVLEAIHASLMAYHRDALTAAGMWERVSTSRPVDGYLSLWDHKTAGFGAGTHGMKGGAISAWDVPKMAMQPFGNATDIYLANEAYSPVMVGAAEGSLQLAENVLSKKFGLTRPPWLEQDLYDCVLELGPYTCIKAKPSSVKIDDDEATAAGGPCELPKNKPAKFCDTSLATADRVKDLVSKLTVAEKISLMGADGAPIPRLGLPQLMWGTECLHGVDVGEWADPPGSKPVNGPPAGGGATIFPQPLCTAASFDKGLLGEIGVAISTEARALNNQGGAKATKYMSCWAPNINIFRDPRWGRGSETYGDDPALTSELAVAFVRGLQGNHSKFRRVIATPKHYTGYSVEEVDGYSRTYFPGKFPAQDLTETYLPAWKAVVQKGNVGSVMCSYNAINNVPSCASPEFQTEILRGKLGFEGFVVSDCGAVENIATAFHYNRSLAAAAATAVKAGCDIECGGAHAQLNVSLKQQMLTQDTMDQALSRMFTQQFLLGIFDPAAGNPYKTIPPSVVGSSDHMALALRAAESGIVLLKNTESRLPLHGTPKVAVLGASGNDTMIPLGNYHGSPYANAVSTPFEAIAKRVGAGNAAFKPGAWPSGEGTWAFGDAIDAAAAADVAVVCIGSSSAGTQNGFTYYDTVEKESMDRRSIALSGMQLDLVQAIASQTTTPIVVVLIHGGPIDVSALMGMARVEAVLTAGYPGQRGGEAIANVLWGETPPSGRLPMTWPFANYTAQISEADMAMRPFPGRGRFMQGLSYTSWEHALATAAPPATGFAWEDPTAVTVMVSNVGDTASAHVVVLFGVPPPRDETDIDETRQPPRRVLLGFERLAEVEPSQTVTVRFHVTPAEQMGVSDADGVLRPWEGCWRLEVDEARGELCASV